MLTTKEALDEARSNMAHGTTIAARLKESADSPEVRQLAEALHFIGFGAQQIALALTEPGRVNDLPQ
ncbi:hypothetical protein GCM10027039_01820 [Terrabacter koreensis]